MTKELRKIQFFKELEKIIDELKLGALHPFEKKGLGKYPYSYLGVKEKIYTYPNGHITPVGCCDYCGNGLKFEFSLQSSDGLVFKVGSDCIKKAFDLSDPITAKVNSTIKGLEKTKKQSKLENLIALIETKKDDLLLRDHPNEYMKIKGFSYFDYCLYVKSHGSEKTRLKLFKELQKL